MSTGFPQFRANTPQQQLPSSGPQEPPQGPQQGQGLQGPPSPIMQLLGGWHRVSGEIGAVHPQIASMMQKVASATQEALMILAREHTQGQQGQGGLPAHQDSGQSRVPPQQPAGYPPQGTF